MHLETISCLHKPKNLQTMLCFCQVVLSQEHVQKRQKTILLIQMKLSKRCTLRIDKPHKKTAKIKESTTLVTPNLSYSSLELTFLMIRLNISKIKNVQRSKSYSLCCRNKGNDIGKSKMITAPKLTSSGISMSQR